MAQRVIVQDGSFTTTVRKQINDNFEELYAGYVNPFDQDLNTDDSPTFNALTLSGLTSGRVPYVGTNGLIKSESGFYYNDTIDTLNASAINVGNGIVVSGTVTAMTIDTSSFVSGTPVPVTSGGTGHNSIPISINLIIDGQGAVIETGVKGFIQVPFPCTITGWTILSTDAGSPVSGSIVVDIWKDTYANYPPTVADTITAAAKPTLTTAQKSTSTTLTGWTTTVTAGDVLGFNVDSVASVLKVILQLNINKT